MDLNEVILIKGTDAPDMLKSALGLLNEPELFENKDIVLKPNLACWDARLPREVNKWTVTKPQFIADVIQSLKTFKPKSITVAESAFVDNNIDKNYKNMKLKKIINDPNIKLINLDKYPFKSVKFFDRKIQISQFILDAEVLINMPMLKTHGSTIVSIGMKNLKGILHSESKKIFHRFGLGKSIAELSKILLEYNKPTLTLVEGLVGLQGFGPMQTGKPKEVGCIILGKNTVSVDAVSSEIMGISPQEVEHIKLAEQNGVGIADLNKIKVIGDKIEDVKVKFEKAPTEAETKDAIIEILELPPDSVDVIHGHLCSTCALNYIGPVWALRDDAGTNYRQKILLLSAHAEVPDDYEGQLILWGNCQRKNVQKAGKDAIFVKGCPPSLMKGYMTFGKALYRRRTFIKGLIKRLFKGMGKIGKLNHWP